MKIDIDIKMLKEKEREILYWLLYDYEYRSRIGRECRSCKHVQGEKNQSQIKLGYNSYYASHFCAHHMDNVDRIMKKKYGILLLQGLYDTLDKIKKKAVSG